MPYQANYLQSDEEILLGLINHDNAATQAAFTAATVTFGEASSAGDAENVLATNVTLTANTGSGYRGSQTFTYNRVPLSFMDAVDPDLVLVSDDLRIHDLLPALNEHFGVNMTADDIVDGDLPVFAPDVDSVFTITATETSKIFHGSVELTGTAPTIELAVALPVNMLDGLYAPTELPAPAPVGE